MILTKRTNYDSHNLTWSRYFYRIVLRVGREEADLGFRLFERFQRHFSIEGGDDDISISGGATTIEHDDISRIYPHSLHTVSAYPHEVARCRVFDEVFRDVEWATR